MVDQRENMEEMLDRAAVGDGAAWGALLTAHQERLVRMVAFRMDSRLSGRIDAADVVQDALVEASAHREAYFREPTVPPFIWLRGAVSNKLLELHRHHLGTHMRDAKRERALEAPPAWDDTTAALCAQLAGHLTTFYEFDMSKGKRLFGYQPTFAMANMIDDAVAFRAGHTTEVIPTHI